MQILNIRRVTPFLFILFQAVASAPTNENGDNALSKWWTTFSTSVPRYAETSVILKEMEQLFPDLVKLYSIGKSVDGLEMWTIHVAENVKEPRPLLRPMVKIVANMHGDETLGRALGLMLVTNLIQGYQKEDSRIVNLLKSTDIHFLVSANPDGFEVSVEGNCKSLPGGVGRFNKNKVDLNRNFPDQFNLRDTPIPEPETINIMKWIRAHPFVLSANLHGGAIVANYPFDSISPEKVKFNADYKGLGIPSLSPDNSVFVYLAKMYSLAHKEMSKGYHEGCDYNFTDGITNGANWYSVVGGMQDFNYVHSSCFEITLELSCCKFPEAKTYLQEWENNKEALLQFLESAHMGVKGLLSDGKNGITGQIKIHGNSYGVRTSSRGEYWRLLMPGWHEVRAEIKGESSTPYKRIQILDSKSPVILNFTIPRISDDFMSETVDE